MQRQFLLIAFGLVLSACNTDASLRSDAEAAVAAQLFDPTSAEFSDIFIPDVPDNLKAVCGWVTGRSATNTLGQKLRFIFIKASDVAAIEIPRDVGADQHDFDEHRRLFDMVWRDTCEVERGITSS